MDPLVVYILYGIFGGPALALSYGLREFTPLYCFLILSLTYVISVVAIHLILLWFGLQYRFRNKIFSRASAMVKERGNELALKMDDVVVKFRKEFGDWGFYLALVSFTFVFGVYWAGLIAFILQVDLWRAIFSIGVGAVLSVAFWTYIILEHNLDPMTVTLFFLLLTILLILYGLVRENKAISNITERITSKIEKLI